MQEQLICHYTKREVAMEKILVTKQLRLGQIGQTNDPRESKPWEIPIPFTSGLQGKEREKEEELVKETISEIRRVMKEEWKVLCFTSEKQPLNSEKWPLNLEINCLLEGIEEYYFNHCYTHPRMWAQYAENHTGVCLIFDKNKLDQSINDELGQRCKLYQGLVQYDKIHSGEVITPLPRTLIEDIGKFGTTNSARKYLLDWYKFFFLRKHPDWETEVEYRWPAHSEKSAPEFVSITNSILMVLVGVDFPQNSESDLINLCKDLQIPAKRFVWKNGMPVLDHFIKIYEP